MISRGPNRLPDWITTIRSQKNCCHQENSGHQHPAQQIGCSTTHKGAGGFTGTKQTRLGPSTWHVLVLPSPAPQGTMSCFNRKAIKAQNKAARHTSAGFLPWWRGGMSVLTCDTRAQVPFPSSCPSSAKRGPVAGYWWSPQSRPHQDPLSHKDQLKQRLGTFRTQTQALVGFWGGLGFVEGFGFFSGRHVCNREHLN